jgi:hypothetical protein
MGDKKTDKEPRIDNVLNLAERAFWDAVEEQYEEIEAESTIRNTTEWTAFRRAARAAIGEWLRKNKPVTSPASARCDFEVQMRPPRKGERGWLVEALTAEAALEEILRESEDIGWTAEKDYDDSFDDCGTHAVTIVLRPAIKMLTQDELMKAQGFVVSPMVKVPAGTPAPLGTVTAGRFTSDCSGVGPVVSGKSEWAELAHRLPEYDGWKATWEYPGYINWSNPQVPDIYVCATPDYRRDSTIAIDINNQRDGSTHEFDGGFGDQFWPLGATRTPGTYMGVIRPVLDKVFAEFGPKPDPVIPDADTYEGNDIFKDVVAALQNAEEMGGPTGKRYLALMQRVADEANRRANTYREILAAKTEGT